VLNITQLEHIFVYWNDSIVLHAIQTTILIMVSSSCHMPSGHYILQQFNSFYDPLACHTPEGHYALQRFFLSFSNLISISARPLGSTSPNFLGCRMVGFFRNKRFPIFKFQSLGELELNMRRKTGTICKGHCTPWAPKVRQWRNFKFQNISIQLGCDINRILTSLGMLRLVVPSRSHFDNIHIV